MDQYKLEYQKGSGTFSIVFTALSLKTGNHVAIKCIKKKFESTEKVKKLKQIQALNALSTHPHIIQMIEALYDQNTGKLALVFELMDMNLYQCFRDHKNILTPHQIKMYMFQVLTAINFMHKKGIFHRDIKPENILIKGDIAKLADLGSCKGKYAPHPHTDYISTRWYRAPQCLLTDGYYGEKMDMWGYGCVLYQIFTRKPLFPGKDELDQIHKINNVLGTPKNYLLQRFRSQATHMQINFQPKKGTGIDKLLPASAPKDLKDLLIKLLAYDHQERLTSEQALQHSYFSQYTTQLNHIQSLTPTNRDFRATNYPQKDPHFEKDKSQEDQNQFKTKKNFSKQKSYRSKKNLLKNDGEGFPKILILPNQMENYKKTFYGKKQFNESPLAFIQGKKFF